MWYNISSITFVFIFSCYYVHFYCARLRHQSAEQLFGGLKSMKRFLLGTITLMFFISLFVFTSSIDIDAKQEPEIICTVEDPTDSSIDEEENGTVDEDGAEASEEDVDPEESEGENDEEVVDDGKQKINMDDENFQHMPYEGEFNDWFNTPVTV